MSKKMKLTPTSTCPLFNVKVTEDESVAIGSSRVWVCGLLAFLTKFDRFDEDPIPLSCIVEARSKSMAMHTSTPLLDAMKKAFDLSPIPCAVTSSPLPCLNNHNFWLSALEHEIYKALVNSLRLDCGSAEDIIPLVYAGVMYTYCWNPVVACDVLRYYTMALSNEVSGERFWSFNPIALVKACLWTRDLRKLLFTHVEKFQSTLPRPLSYEHACASMPNPPYRSIDETSVSDQDRAIYFIQDNPAAYMHTMAYSVLINSMGPNMGLYYFQSDDTIL
jgi:hypothetical protein